MSGGCAIRSSICSRPGADERLLNVNTLFRFLRSPRAEVVSSSSSVRPPGASSIGSPGAKGFPDLKIGIFIPSFLKGPGGAEKVAGQVANVISEAGSTVELFCRAPVGHPPTYSVNESVRIRLLSEQDDRQLERLRRDRFDLIVCFGMAHFYRRVPHIAQMLEAPFVIQECTNPGLMTGLVQKFSDSRSEEDAYWLRQAVLAHASAVRFTNPVYASSVVEQVRPFVYAFHNAFRVPADDRAESDKQPAKKLICVGSFKNDNKNGIAALSAFCAFARRHYDWSLFLYGENNCAGDVARLVKKNPQAIVRDEGVTRDIRRIYGDAHALIIPSYEEGLPNVVVEALSFGVPCIGFRDCEAVAYLINHGENGLLVDREDPEGLERALEAVVDIEARQRMSVGARKFAAEHFNFESWRQDWLQMIGNAANGLNNQLRGQRPIACEEYNDEAVQWTRLLESFRAVG